MHPLHNIATASSSMSSQMTSRGLTRPLHAQLWQLCVCRTSCLSPTTFTVRTQRRSSFGISTSSLRPRVWRYRDTALTASAGTGQL